MLDSKTPIKRLAITEFRRQFGDLFSIKAEIDDFERILIENTYELMWLNKYSKSDLKKKKKTVRASFSFLDKGFLVSPKKVAMAFTGSIELVPPALNNSWSKKVNAESVSPIDFDEQIERYLSFYKTMYEGLIPVIMAPIVYSFALYRKISNISSFKPHSDGRISLNAINKMDKWRIRPQNRLAIGLNNHIRNAYSHERYRILDDAKVEMWDKNIHKKKKWGPEIWSLEELKDICNLLWHNSQAITCALALFSINNKKTIHARGWFTPSPVPQLREAELRSSLEQFAGKLSFKLKNHEINEKNINLTLATKPKGINQESEIFVGGKIPRKFIQPIRYVEVPVIEQTLGFLQSIYGLVAPDKILSISFIDWTDEQLGKISIKVSKIAEIQGPELSTFDIERKKLITDTLDMKKMWRKDEYQAVEV